MFISFKKVFNIFFTSPARNRLTSQDTTTEEKPIKEPDLTYPKPTSTQDRELQKAVDKYFIAFTTLKSIKEAREAMAQTYKKVGFKDYKSAFRSFLDRRSRKTTSPMSSEETTAVVNALLTAIPLKLNS
ncbi:MAG: hypothetical protein HY094_07590 [Candidatus Melainabacteria bacterium]|nr:hypothetical protein [Candidatus Melainabacteria bacterium]